MVHIRYIAASESLKTSTNGDCVEYAVSSVQKLKLQNENATLWLQMDIILQLNLVIQTSSFLHIYFAVAKSIIASK